MNAINQTQKTYWIAYTDTTMFRYGTVEPGEFLTSGQPYIWSSTIEEEWLSELLTKFNTDPYFVPVVEEEPPVEKSFISTNIDEVTNFVVEKYNALKNLLGL